MLKFLRKGDAPAPDSATAATTGGSGAQTGSGAGGTSVSGASIKGFASCTYFARSVSFRSLTLRDSFRPTNEFRDGFSCFAYRALEGS